VGEWGGAWSGAHQQHVVAAWWVWYLHDRYEAERKARVAPGLAPPILTAPEALGPEGLLWERMSGLIGYDYREAVRLTAEKHRNG
jgi:hypothetical protein